MDAFLGIVGILGFCVFLILALVSLFKKNRKKGKRRLLFALGFLVLFIIGVSMPTDSKSDKTKVENKSAPPTSSKTEETKKENQPPAKKTVELTPQQKMLKDIKALIDSGSKQAFDTGS